MSGQERGGPMVTAYLTLEAELAEAKRERDEARADAAAVRELMNVYNLGGWTDAVAPMKRALAAESHAEKCFCAGMEEAARLLDEEAHSASALTEEAAERGDSHAKMRLWAIRDHTVTMAQTVRHFAADAEWCEERRAALAKNPAPTILGVDLARPGGDKSVEVHGRIENGKVHVTEIREREEWRPGVELIAAERQRQIEKEGWDAKHDTEHCNGELAMAAAAYAFQSVGQGVSMPRTEHGFTPLDLWPWDAEWWKPKDRRRDLVRAGALIVAELDRIEREEARAETPDGE